MKSVRPINVRRLLASDSEFVKDCKEQQTLLVPHSPCSQTSLKNKMPIYTNQEQQQQQMLVTNGGTEANPKQPLSLAKVSIVF